MFEKTLHKFISFGVVGVLAFFLDWVIFNFVFYLTKFFLFSLALGWVVSMTFNFTINRNYTFGAKGHHMGKQLYRWLIVHAVAFLARAGMGKLVLMVLGGGTLNANIAFFSGLIVSIPTTFFGSLWWVFKKNN